MTQATNQYRSLWQELGLDLASHDALLEAVGKAYHDAYLSQENRPEGMKYFDFVVSEIHGLRVKELMDARKEGRKVVGTYCTFVPEEIVLAANGIMVGLCSGADFALEEVEKILPRNLCALIKSSFGFKLGKVCPYLEASDMIVGENTCDGKKKAYEELGKLADNLYIMDLPQTKNGNSKEFLRTEYKKFIKAMEQLSGVSITVEKLQRAIETVNNKRKAIHRLSKLRAHAPAPISGLDSLLVNQIAFFDDPVRFTDSVNTINAELEERSKANDGPFAANTPRILLSGCPLAVPNWKVPFIVESSGAVIVGEESCVGERGTRNLVDTTADTIDGCIDALVDRYLSIDCAIFTPNPDRLSHIQEMVRKYNADGVILYGLNFCTPYLVEAMNIEKVLENQGIPSIRIETDYSREDVGQLKTRIEAFIERIQG
ncbi:MAG: 2-hydroxyacyl-CoA dehydratase [Chitinivibrionales bacterium]|nr:2-hydroxyacyl-CoA dehydratase [Chitinivibrionales bacterium]